MLRPVILAYDGSSALPAARGAGCPPGIRDHRDGRRLLVRQFTASKRPGTPKDYSARPQMTLTKMLACTTAESVDVLAFGPAAGERHSDGSVRISVRARPGRDAGELACCCFHSYRSSQWFVLVASPWLGSA